MGLSKELDSLIAAFHLYLTLPGRNRRDHLMAKAALVDTVLPLIFYYRSHLPPMATLITWFKAKKLNIKLVFAIKNYLWLTLTQKIAWFSLV